MFQQLLNTTAIWLLCLLAYDIFLGKETYHRYNRLYLLASLLLGAILPAINWQPDSMVYSVVYDTPIQATVQQVASVKQSIETTVLPEAPELNTSLIILFIYLIGCVFSLALIAREIVMLVRFYAKGTKRKEGKWTVVETNKPHGPFSIFNCIFVSNKRMYDEKEWNILLSHEGEHIDRNHFIDIVIIQLSKVVFWFHPLVYLFQSRILMIHEYQADAVGADEPSEYGTFLIEQAMLQTTPSITHSFNRSPIKKRILMLTRRSSKAKMLKALVAIPVAFCCIFCFTNNAYSNKKGKGDGNTLNFKGNTIEFEGKHHGTMLIKNDNANANKEGGTIVINGQGNDLAADETIEVSFSVPPIRVNGDTIYSAGDVSEEPKFLGKDKTLTHYLFNSVKNELGRLADGEYFIHISYPVVDRKGTLVYYGMDGVTLGGPGKIDAAAKSTIDKKLNEALENAPKYQPAKVNGKPVAWYDAWGVELGYRLIVKDHVAKLEYKEPKPFRP